MDYRRHARPLRQIDRHVDLDSVSIFVRDEIDLAGLGICSLQIGKMPLAHEPVASSGLINRAYGMPCDWQASAICGSLV